MPGPDVSSRGTTLWQWALLPAMLLAIIGTGSAFYYFGRPQYAHRGEPDAPPPVATELATVFTRWERAPPGPTRSEAVLRLEVAAVLEARTVENRYRQANYAVSSRVWTRYVAFLTGMALALIGAVFVLGRLREPFTKMSADGGGFRGSLTSSSPGIVLAALGTALMMAALLVNFDVRVTDGSVYLQPPPVNVGDAPTQDPVAWPAHQTADSSNEEERK